MTDRDYASAPTAELVAMFGECARRFGYGRVLDRAARKGGGPSRADSLRPNDELARSPGVNAQEVVESRHAALYTVR
jgi:hypothetical protein